MKRNLLVLMVSAVAVIGLCSFTSHLGTKSSNCELSHKVDVHVHATGKRCDGTVGCGCPGFAPIQHKEVWKYSYCKHCGHHKTYHK